MLLLALSLWLGSGVAMFLLVWLLVVNRDDPRPVPVARRAEASDIRGSTGGKHVATDARSPARTRSDQQAATNEG